jgi:hypothetical protein
MNESNKGRTPREEIKEEVKFERQKKLIKADECLSKSKTFF